MRTRRSGDGEGARAIALPDRLLRLDQAAERRKLAAARAHTTLDLANLAEEVESLGRSDLATIRSQLRRIIEHLLKLEHSLEAEPRFSWRESVIDARDVIPDVITTTLGREVEAELAKTYEQGRRRAEVALLKHGERAAAKALLRTAPTASTRSSATTGTRPIVTSSSTTWRMPERDLPEAAPGRSGR